MFFGIPQPTPFDLHWRMFGIDVRVHPFFWLMSVMLGWDWFQEMGPVFLALWVACVFVSILLHEVGHVVMGRVFGSYGYIVLHSFGGLAIHAKDGCSRWQRILVSFAGPFGQFILFGLVLVLAMFVLPAARLGANAKTISTLDVAVVMLLEINLIWPLLNLLPIYPLDGGQISREVCEGVVGRRGTVISLWISLAVAGLLALNSLMASKQMPLIPFLPFGSIYMAIFFALMAVSSFQMLQQEMNRARYDERMPWE